MNVCFYTGSDLSAASLLNISYLVNKRPGDNYSFIQVASGKKSESFSERIRRIYIETRFNDGRFDFQNDLLTIEKNLRSNLLPFNKSEFEVGSADAVNDLKSEQFLTQRKPDVIIQAGAGILKENIFGKAKIATINLHHGVAPEIRGIHSTFWCMFYGISDKIGVTCHIIDQHLDTGAVIQQDTLKTSSRSFIDIQTENYLMGRDVLLKSMNLLEKGSIKTENRGQVKSYYFGNVDPFLYYALKKRNFHPLMNIAQRAFKMKDANFISGS